MLLTVDYQVSHTQLHRTVQIGDTYRW